MHEIKIYVLFISKFLTKIKPFYEKCQSGSEHPLTDVEIR